MIPFEDQCILCSLALLGIALYLLLTRNVPPGPYGLPIVGYLPFLTLSRLPEQMGALGEKFGHLYSFYCGSRLVIVLNDWESTKAAFIHQAENFSARPLNHPFITSERSQYNLEVSEGEHWKEHKKFASQTLRNLGMGKSSMEPSISAEVQQFTAELEKRTGVVTNITDVLTPSVLNVLSSLCSGTRYDYHDPQLRQLMKMFFDVFDDVIAIPLLIAFPWMKRVPGIERLIGLTRLRKAHGMFLDFIEQQVNEHERIHTADREDDYMHAFISEKIRRQMKPTQDTSLFTNEVLTDIVTSNFYGGAFGTVITLQWAVLYLTLCPDIQERLRNEIDTVIGRDRTASFEDRHRTPYADAVVWELIRHPKTFPLNSPHSNFTECQVLGRRIPERSFVISNIWYVNHDPKLWDEPNSFKPERFISPDGNVSRPEYLMTFSCGKRSCPGDTLVRMQVYLYVVAMVQKFELIPPPGIKMTDETTGHFIGIPKFQNIILKTRQ